MGSVVNPEMAAAWDGADGERWIAHEQQHERAVERHTARMFAAAAIAANERVLDIGCGCGQTTCDAARIAVDGAAVGIDLSRRMLERARSHAVDDGLTNVTFVHGDAQVYSFPREEFDAVISRQGSMFFADPVAAFANIRSGLHPRGRVALLVWQALERNEWMLAFRDALLLGRDIPERPSGTPGPFGLADPHHVRSVMSDAGYEHVELEDVDEPFVLGRDVDDAWDFAQGVGVVRGLLADLDHADAARALAQLRTTIEAHATDHGVHLGSRSWVITATRTVDAAAR